MSRFDFLSVNESSSLLYLLNIRRDVISAYNQASVKKLRVACVLAVCTLYRMNTTSLTHDSLWVSQAAGLKPEAVLECRWSHIKAFRSKDQLSPRSQPTTSLDVHLLMFNHSKNNKIGLRKG